MFRLGDGATSFWYHNWSGIGCIANMVPFVDIHDVQIELKDLIHNSSWKLQQLYTPLPAGVVLLLQKIKPVLNINGGGDIWTWKNSSSGAYTVKDAYDWQMTQAHEANQDMNWNWI